MKRRAFLSSGVVSCVLLTAMLGGSMPAQAAGTDFSHFQVDGALLLQSYRSLVEEHLAGVLRTIRTLAATSDARTGSWASVRPALARLSGDLATAAAVWYAQPDGSYDTVEKGPIDKTLKDRAYFPDLLAGKDVVGVLVVSKSTGERSIIVATPVRKQGQTVGVIGVSLRALSVSQLVIDRVGMPDSLTFYALDQHGRSAIHKDPAKMFQYPSDMGDKFLRDAVEMILLQRQGMVTYRLGNTDRIAIFDTSKLTGWHFVLVELAK